ncbi:MAG TPA: lmo0937 family membrane protein [Candidatus Saccharimonadales bacterium]|nr:lmo0937 family membrane protein [Candidatus Saccharimonadales bacterium]
MLLAALIVLLLWLLGFSFHIAGGFIHLLLIIGVIMLIIRLLNGRRAPTV